MMQKTISRGNMMTTSNNDITPEEEANTTYLTTEEWIAKYGDVDEYDIDGNLVKRAGDDAVILLLEKIEKEKELNKLDSLWGDDDNE